VVIATFWHDIARGQACPREQSAPQAFWTQKFEPPPQFVTLQPSQYGRATGS
jgi:hypothetical protein